MLLWHQFFFLSVVLKCVLKVPSTASRSLKVIARASILGASSNCGQQGAVFRYLALKSGCVTWDRSLKIRFS